MTRVLLFLAVGGLLTGASTRGGDADRVSAFDVVWESPSQDHHGSMPLGNGDVALNVWLPAGGDLQFYISKTDAWDDNARLVKVGKVRLRLEPNPFASGGSFRQRLSLRDATVTFEGGEGADRTRLRVWVDAHRPAIEVEVESAEKVEAVASVELWRTNRQELTELQVSDVLTHRKGADGRQLRLVLEPDVVLANQPGRIGWYHHNVKSVGPALLAEVQGLSGFTQPDPILHRTFGAIVTADGGERLDDLRLRSQRGVSHRFRVMVVSRHPSTPEEWLREAERQLSEGEAKECAVRRRAHEEWWSKFWERSWIQATAAPGARTATGSLVPTNAHPVRIGADQSGGNLFAGELGRVSVWARPLSEAEVAALAKRERIETVPGGEELLFSWQKVVPRALEGSAAWGFPDGFTVEAWVNPRELPGGGGRLLDKITPGGSDGFLLDTYPGNSLRLICGPDILQQDGALPAGRWTHVVAVADAAAGGCRLYRDGQRIGTSAGTVVRDEAAYVSQAYCLQRFITACAGRGAYPIKFNGSLFTVPPGPTEQDPDFRRWGPGYWWQNTRLPYISLCTSGDFDLQRPLYRMYAEELLPLGVHRTRRYFGHGGAFYPECIYFWGAVFGESYGWTPFEERADKLQESGWHKWEWVGGLELCRMMLDYFEHTGDAEFLRGTLLPCAREVLTFFDQHYPTNAQGKLVMHPAQALETWWHCTNAMPEVAGCIAVTDRLLALPVERTSQSDRQWWQRFRARLPDLPLRVVDGRKALAPAEFFAQKNNIENPELYAVFPFRLIAVGRPNLEWGLTALEHRWDRGNSGWRQDDIFMAYLGLTDAARQNVVGRARSHDRNERFPAFWGPNYDWTPDQDHGGVLMKAVQAMLLQTDGRRIFLLPAWPGDWDVEFKLHAPQRTVIEGVYRGGRVQQLRVTPEARRRDVECALPLP